MLHCLKLFWLNWGFPLKVVGVYLIGWFWLCSEIHNEDEFEFQFNMAQRESANAFGDDTMYIERFVENPRHVEIRG